MKKFVFIPLILLLILSGCGDPADSGESKMSDEQIALMERFPDYFGLDDSSGLDVIVWQMAPNSWSFALLEHSDVPRDFTGAEMLGRLLNLKGAKVAEMREILATYTVDDSRIFVIPWQNPISSYLPEWCIDFGGEDMNEKAKTYVDNVRKMLLD